MTETSHSTTPSGEGDDAYRTDRMLVITKAEYHADPGKWIRLSGGDLQVGIANEKGEVLIVLGTGPYTDEEKARATATLERIDRELAAMPPVRVEDLDTSWID